MVIMKGTKIEDFKKFINFLRYCARCLINVVKHGVTAFKYGFRQSVCTFCGFVIMRRTPVLFSQLSRMRKWNWYIKGKVEVRPTPAKELLERHGYEVVDVKDVLFPPTVRER